MDPGLSRRKIPQRSAPTIVEPSVKVSDLLSFSSAIAAVALSAIFYLAGWIYLAHWYAFFGLDAAQLDLAPQFIIIHGLPSMLILIVAGFASLSCLSIWKMFTKAERLKQDDIPLAIIIAYIFAVFMMITILCGYVLQVQQIPLRIPAEAFVAFTVSYVLATIIYLLYQTVLFLTADDFSFSVAGRFISFGVISFKPARIYAISRLFNELYKQGEHRQAFEMALLELLINVKLEITPDLTYFSLLTRLIPFSKTLPSRMVDYEKKLDETELEFVQKVNAQKSQWTNVVTATWQFWVGVVLILYFLVSISTSSVLGEWDAQMGRKSMVGGWQAEETYIYSDKTNLPLPTPTANATQGPTVYGPLMIIAKVDETYYLTDWVDKFPFIQKPDIYVIKLTESTNLGIHMMAPTPMPTLTLYPTPTLTITPTLTLTPVLTVTPTPTP